MEEYSVETFANRGDPIPVLNVLGSAGGSAGLSSDEESDQHMHLKLGAAASSIRDKLNYPESPKTRKRGHSLQDKLFAKFVKCRHETQGLQEAQALADEVDG